MINGSREEHLSICDGTHHDRIQVGAAVRGGGSNYLHYCDFFNAQSIIILIFETIIETSRMSEFLAGGRVPLVMGSFINSISINPGCWPTAPEGPCEK